jgi:hypothetical protein
LKSGFHPANLLLNQLVCQIGSLISLENILFIDADQRQNQRFAQREQRTPVEHDLEREKHTLRLMKGEYRNLTKEFDENFI